jgi:multiple sugar transport system ATP-binding protein
MGAKIEVNDLRKEYDVGSGTELAVDNISFDIGEEEFVTLVGPSGCGKTTTLRCIAGLETPTDGEILFDGEDITGTPSHKRNLSMMFQNIALYPHMKVWKNIAYPLKVRGVSEDVQRKEASEAAGTVHLSDEFLDKFPGDLSGGQRQRAALARTIVQEPFGFLMDEPLSDLDAKLQIRIRKEIQQVHRRLKKPTLYVTHDQEEAMTMSDRVVVMNDGNIEQVGNRDELYHYPENVFVAQFLGNPSMNFFDVDDFSVDEDTMQLAIDGSRLESRVDTYENGGPKSSVRLGIRPHDFNINPGDQSGVFDGTITLIEPVDDRAIVTIETESQDITATIPSDSGLQEGDNVSLGIETSGLYVFDEETTDLIARSAY